MTEDSLYRQSSQYKTWSFTAAKLASLRQHTNERGIKAVQRNWKKTRQAAAAAGVSTDDVENPEYLTVEEELTLIRFYCGKIIELSDHFQFPSNVKATAVIFLHRFHLHHSTLLYHPKHHLPTVLFLSTKTENHYIPLVDFCKKIPKSTPEAILKHEFLVAGGVGWDLDVRHPLRALEGGVMDLLTAISRDSPDLKWRDTLGQDANTAADRVKDAHKKTRTLLTTTALLSDVYFLYTPPQIFLGAFHSVDTDLCTMFITWKLSSPTSSSSSSSPDHEAITKKLLDTIAHCATLLTKATSYAAVPLEEVKRIDKKLYRCQHPEKYIVLPTKTAAAEEEEDERQMKKRKMEREKLEKSGDVFKSEGRKGGTGNLFGGNGNLFGGVLKGKE